MKSLRKLLEVPIAPLRTNPIVFLDITIERESVGRITIELFQDAVPKTSENFRSLCTGERGIIKYPWKKTNRCPLHFKGTPIHRVIPNFVIQGGDILRGNGRGNESVFGYRFMDESFQGKAGDNLPGTLAMAHHGPNQNGSQFFINLGHNKHLNGRYVVFGQVLEGGDVCEKLNDIGSQCGTLRKRAWIAECGQSGAASNEQFDKQDWYMMPPQNYLDNINPRV
eukprot:PhF_6_TR35099/c0_g1_i1/m.51154/K01802/E5.2.1.8; peptidylprolyl isomerase